METITKVAIVIICFVLVVMLIALGLFIATGSNMGFSGSDIYSKKIFELNKILSDG